MKKITALLLIYTLIYSPAMAKDASGGFDKDAYLRSGLEDKKIELTVKQCIEMALKKNTEINISRISPDIEDANVLIQMARFEPSLSADLDYQSNVELSGVTLYGVATQKSKTGSFNFGYDQKLVTGTSVELDYNNSRNWTNSSLNRFNPYYDSLAQVTVTQPLAKGYGITVNKADYLIAKNNKQKSKDAFANDVINVLSNVKVNYYDYLYRQEQYQVADISLTRVKNLYEINVERFKKGLASDVDLIQLEAEVARYEKALLSSGYEMRLSEDNLKYVTNLIDDIEYWNASVVLLDKPEYGETELSLADFAEQAFAYRPDYQAAKLDLKNRDISVIYNKNGLFPTIDLTGSYGLNGLSGSFGKDMGHVGGGKYPEWSAGVNVVLPLGNNDAKGKYKKSVLEKEQTLLAFQRLEQKIILEIRDAIRNVDTSFKLVLTSAKVKEAQDKQYRAQLERFKEGLVSTHDMIDYQERLALAEVGYIKSIIDYNIALIGLSKAKGTTLIQENITLQ